MKYQFVCQQFEVTNDSIPVEIITVILAGNVI